MQSLPGSMIAPQSNEEITNQLKSWASGIQNEIDFWKEWLDTGGGDYPGDFEYRLKTDTAWPAERIPVPQFNWKILDVGAGPATLLPKMIDGKRLDITATDPLAPFYKVLRDGAGYAPPIETIQAFAEDLTAVFAPNTFDLTSIENALDHSRNPLRGIEEMLIVTKVGGAIVLRHGIDEASRGAYDGLHQWNFNSREGKFIIWNKQGETSVNDVFAGFARIETELSRERPNTGPEYDMDTIKSIIWKEADLPIDINRRRQERLQALLSASLVAMQPMDTIKPDDNFAASRQKNSEPSRVLDWLRKGILRR